MENITTYLIELLKTNGPKVLMAIAFLVIGLWIIGFVMKGIGKLMENRKVDETLRPFLTTLMAFVLKALLFISVATMVGIQTTSFVALLGAAGLAIGMALQGSLAHFAGGVMILIFKPFKVGDLIEAQDGFGFVKEISVFVTIIETFQNKTVIIPNGPLSGGNIVNYSKIGNVRADINFAVRYDNDPEKAREIVLEVLKSSDKVLQDPAPSVYITELSDNSIKLVALPYTTVADYWDVFWGLNGDIKKALDANGFKAPYPHRVNING